MMKHFVLTVALLAFTTACTTPRATQEQRDLYGYEADNPLRPDRTARVPPRQKGEEGMIWTVDQQIPIFKPGVTYRGHYHPMICPTVPRWFVLRPDGTVVKTLAELRATLRPIDTRERALSYRDLLAEVALDGEEDAAFEKLQTSRRLRFDPEREEPFCEIYIASDAQRWGIGREPVVEGHADHTVITQPAYSLSVEFFDPGPTPGTVTGPMTDEAVELVRETITRDGEYAREVVRVLERGESANVYKPWPLL